MPIRILPMGPKAQPAKRMVAALQQGFIQKFGAHGGQLPDHEAVAASALPARSPAAEALRVFEKTSDRATAYRVEIEGKAVLAVAWFGELTHGVELFDAMGQRFAHGCWRDDEDDGSWKLGTKSPVFEAAKADVG